MTVDYNKVLAKLDRPPSGPNWVRFVHRGVASTTKSIVSFAKGIPQVTYASGNAAIRDRIQLGIDRETAIKMTQRSGSPKGRRPNAEFVNAFYDYDEIRGYPSNSYIEFEKEWFRVSRDVKVPVSPLSVIREKGQFVPIFVCGWSELTLSEFQRRLLVTICEDAFLSLTDFQNSPAEYLFFPKVDNGEEKVRAAEVWQRGDYTLLTDAELNEAVQIFLQSRDDARKILTEERDLAAREIEHSVEAPTHLDQKDMFRPED